MAENVLFGSEFDGKPIIDGVNEVVVKLAELKQAQKELRDETARLNKELNDNQKELTETKTALDLATKAGDPKKIKELSDQIAILTQREKELKVALKEAGVEQVVLQKGQAFYSRQINETIKNQTAVNEQLGKFGSVSRLAGEAVGRFRTFVQEAAFGLVSGFAGAIIASALPAITQFVTKLIESIQHVDAFTKKLNIQNEVAESAGKAVAGQVTKLEAYRKVLNDLTVPESERLRVAKEFNKTADQKNQIDTTQINNLGQINTLLDQQKEKLLQVALANAAVAKVSEAATPFLEQDLKLRLAANQLGITKTLLEGNLKLFEQLEDRANRNRIVIRGATAGAVANPIRKEDQELLDNFSKSLGLTEEELSKLLDTFNESKKAKKNLDEVTTALQDLFTATSVTTSDPGDKNTPVNVFIRELTRLQEALKGAQAKLVPSEFNISEQFKAALDKQLLDIDKFLDAKSHERVTPAQAEFLKSIVKRITGIQEGIALEDFRKKIQDLVDKINDQIDQVQTDSANKRIANIRDDQERENAQIEQGFQNTVAAIGKAKANFFKQLDEDAKQGVDPAIIKQKKLLAESLFGGLIDEATTTKNNQLLDSNFKAFQKTITDSDAVFEESLTELSENIGNRIKAEKDALARGEISVATFQKHVTALVKQGKEERDQIRKEELEADLTKVQNKIDVTTDPEQLAQLRKQAREIREQIATINSSVEPTKDDPTKKRIENLVKYAQSAQQLLGSIVGFWAQVNAAEEKSLERSISLQQKRVEEARVIAERGNAQYLNEEQDRLDQLELKRAASARKQQAINSALVLSQALVATVSAIAQAASTSGPAAPFAAIAAGIAVIGAITAAFQFVNSLQPPVATFFTGTERVERGSNKPGIDTIPARLTEGERVVTARENKEYFETLTAIHNRRVSPEVLNSFVRQTLTGQKQGQGENRLPGKQIERVRETVLKDRHSKERETFTEKVKEQKVSKEQIKERWEQRLAEHNLVREIGKEVSRVITNNQDKTEIFDHVEKVLISKFEQRPLIVPQIMKEIQDRVNQRDVTTVTNNIKQVSQVLESFSDRISTTILQKYSTTFAAKYSRRKKTFHEVESDHLVERLSEQLVNNMYVTDKEKEVIQDRKEAERITSESLDMIRETLYDRVNFSDASVVVPYVIEKLTEKMNWFSDQKSISKELKTFLGKDHKDTDHQSTDKTRTEIVTTKTDQKEFKATDREKERVETKATDHQKESKTVEVTDKTKFEKISDKIKTELINTLQTFANSMNEKVVDKAGTKEVIRELSQVNQKEAFREIDRLKETLYNPETAKVLIPYIKDQVTNENDKIDKNSLKYVYENSKLFNQQRTDHLTKIIERFSDKVNKTETQQVIRELAKETFLQTNKDYRETIQAVFDKKIDSKVLNNFVTEHSETHIDRKVNELFREYSNTLQNEKQNNRERTDQKTIGEKTNDQKTVYDQKTFREILKQENQKVTFREILQTNQAFSNQVIQKYSRQDVPVVSYERLQHATTVSHEREGYFAEQIRIMKENTELQKETNKILKVMGFEFNFDKEGVSAMIMKYQAQKKIDLKT